MPVQRSPFLSMLPKQSKSLMKSVFPDTHRQLLLVRGNQSTKMRKEATTCFLDCKSRGAGQGPEHRDRVQRTSGSLTRNTEISEAFHHLTGSEQGLHVNAPVLYPTPPYPIPQGPCQRNRSGNRTDSRLFPTFPTLKITIFCKEKQKKV